jgi:hypothetical protein
VIKAYQLELGDIETGKKYDANQCAVAICLARNGVMKASVGPDTACGVIDGRNVFGVLSDEARNIVWRFDHMWPDSVQPAEFTVTWQYSEPRLGDD